MVVGWRFSRMTKFKVLAIVALAPMLAACVPAPEDMCQHMFEIMKKEHGADVFPASDEDYKKDRESCVRALEREKETLGVIAWSTSARCVMAAVTLEDLSKCNPTAPTQ
jgi:transcriptional regulator of nitric oxide reductase